jgi:hypothetical protein
VGLRPSKPAFHSVLDLGLRDTGVKNDPRRLAAHFGRMSLPLFALVVLSVFAMCAIVSRTGADASIVVAFAVAWTVGTFSLAIRMVKRSPMVVVKVTAEGANQATWLLIPPLLLLAIAAVVVRDVLLIPQFVLTAIMAVLLWRGRRRLPDVLRKLRPLLAANESVLGDGIGLARGARGRRNALRLVVATDRRVLVAAASTRSTERFLLVDVPYARVSRFGIEWKYWGRIGELSLTVPGVHAPSETHVITSIAPANLLSIARALQSRGVHADDPAAVAEAERAWEEAQRRGEPRKRLLDHAAMSTREFDRGLWLLLGLSAVTFYVNPFGVGLGASRYAALPVLLVVPALCAICGYLSGTRSSLAYIAPLNLLVSPAFFFADATDVIGVMLLLSALATIGLWAGSALREATAGRVNAAAGAAASPERRAARGGLRYAISGLGLIRISGVLLAVVVALVAVTAAAGFELTTLRLAVDEATANQLPVDGRSNLTGNAASLTYTPAPDLHEFITDEHWDAGPNDGARWELRSSFTKGYNLVSLAHYIFEPRLDDEAAVREFVADKDREHSRGAGFRVTHTERVVDGRRGYVWNYGRSGRYWYYGAWFPQPIHSVRVECVARGQIGRFKRLCAEAIGSLEFH